MLLIDISKSSLFGSACNQEYNTEIAAVLVFMVNNNDKIGVIFYDDQIVKYIPPKGRQHALFIVSELLTIEPRNGGTDLSKALKYFNTTRKKHCVCVK
jgi:uncharacterized protein (DUF58 family)